LGVKGEHDKAYFYFGEGSIFLLLCWGSAPFSKNIGGGANQMAPFEKINK
jgi:hypothetical protein